MTVEKANRIYDILVEIGGAATDYRNDFIYHHTKESNPCEEWRFGGKLGFGGKYRSVDNRVDCYSEDYNSERKKLISEINKELSKV